MNNIRASCGTNGGYAVLVSNSTRFESMIKSRKRTRIGGACGVKFENIYIFENKRDKSVAETGYECRYTCKNRLARVTWPEKKNNFFNFIRTIL